ncbi:ATP-binding protein [Palleronia sp. LCG004]|nr:ATP-binding protein [Palleronia sp. LCG004]WOI57626.1 ATP-binding protein [Palleronia sp. LCG004]
MRNLVQNAVDYAASTVWIDARWTGTRINLRIADDGPGYPPDLLPYLGDPFTRPRRKPERAKREGYEGMGLGLFIAKTLLERSGAEITFANADERMGPPGSTGRRGGAFVTLSWERMTLERPGGDRRALGENAPTSV